MLANFSFIVKVVSTPAQHKTPLASLSPIQMLAVSSNPAHASFLTSHTSDKNLQMVVRSPGFPPPEG